MAALPAALDARLCTSPHLAPPALASTPCALPARRSQHRAALALAVERIAVAVVVVAALVVVEEVLLWEAVEEQVAVTAVAVVAARRQPQ